MAGTSELAERRASRSIWRKGTVLFCAEHVGTPIAAAIVIVRLALANAFILPPAALVLRLEGLSTHVNQGLRDVAAMGNQSNECCTLSQRQDLKTFSEERPQIDPLRFSAAIAVKPKSWHRMVALPVIPIDADSRLDRRTASSNRLSQRAVAACLIALLIFCTATMFVRDAWALQSFQIGVFVLL